jgi:sulfite reductase (NADPH) hemoprotein beta-component
MHDFLPASEILNVAEAILRLFHRLGDYQHKQRNRLKFLIKTLGWDRFREEVERERQAFSGEGGAPLPFDPERPPVEDAPAGYREWRPSIDAVAADVSASSTRGPGIHPRVIPRLSLDANSFARWSASNAQPQRQPGFSVVTVTTVLGDLTSAQMRVLGRLSDAFGDGRVRLTPDQNLVFRWVPHDDVPAFYSALAAAGLARAGAGTLADVTSCPGAESCRLAVTQARGLGRLLADRLDERPDLAAAVPGLNIKISGCPNGCGQHHIAGIGFQGSLRKVGGKPAPHYFVMVGGGIGDEARFGRTAAVVPARRSADAVERLVALYRASGHPGETATAFFQRVDVSTVKAALADLERLTPDEATPEDFVDLGEHAEFRPEVQDGECTV